jgi:hypothetical protein
VTRGRAAQQRPARLRGQPLGEADAWLEHYRAFWSDRFDRLADQLREIQKGTDR